MMERDRRLQEVISDLQIETQAIRAGSERSPAREHSEPLYATSSFVFADAASMADAFINENGQSIYGRVDNPTVDVFCRRLATLEGGEACEAAASGMGAILATMMAHCQAGDRVVMSCGVFGATLTLLKKFFVKYGVTLDLVRPTDLDAWAAALSTPAKLAYCETPSNPMMEVVDIAGVSQLCRSNNTIFVVDNCLMTSVLQRPLQFGADLVIHSATKYLDGQGRVLGGAVVGSHELIAPITQFLRSGGVTMSAFNAWIFLKGLETLDVRMQAHCARAMELATWLEEHPAVARVHYAGLPSHPQADLITKQMRAGGGVLSLELKQPDQEMAWKFLNGTCLMSLTANLGDVKTTVCHPATTTHGRLDRADRHLMGIGENLIRISVGLESVEDIKMDCERGFQALSHSEVDHPPVTR
jgi:O-succinylhomoserine sulfhydrylase